jgi:nucleolar protein 4
VKTDDGAQDTSTGTLVSSYVDFYPKHSVAAHALFSAPAIAQDTVNKLHAHVFEGSLLSVTLKKCLDTLASHKPAKLSTSTPSVTSTATPSHANWLIIRNLPFTAT